MKKIKMCKPFLTKKEFVEIYLIENQRKYLVKYKTSKEDIKSKIVESYEEALYLFYYNLCWIINKKVMENTSTQRIRSNY